MAAAGADLSFVDPQTLTDEEKVKYLHEMQMKMNEQMAQIVQQQQAAVQQQQAAVQQQQVTEAALADAIAARAAAEQKLLEVAAAQPAGMPAQTAGNGAAPATPPSPQQSELDAATFHKMWMMGQQQERTLGRPRDWNGSDEGFEEFQFKFVNFMSGMPGPSEDRSVRDLLDDAAAAKNEISWGTLDSRTKVIAEGITRMLTSMVGGRALNIIKSNPVPKNGFEAWRRLFAEYKPLTGSRRMSLIEAVIDSRPAAG